MADEQSLGDYFSQYGVNINGRDGVGMDTFIREAQGNMENNALSTIGNYPELTTTGSPTKSAYGTYWTMPTAQGNKYVVPQYWQLGADGRTTPESSLSDHLAPGSNQPWKVLDGNKGYYYAEGTNPSQARWNGDLGLDPGNQYSNWKPSGHTSYNVYDKAPIERYYQYPKEDDSFLGFTLQSLGMAMPVLAMAGGPLGGALGFSGVGLSGGFSDWMNSSGNNFLQNLFSGNTPMGEGGMSMMGSAGPMSTTPALQEMSTMPSWYQAGNAASAALPGIGESTGAEAVATPPQTAGLDTAFDPMDIYGQMNAAATTGMNPSQMFTPSGALNENLITSGINTASADPLSLTLGDQNPMVVNSIASGNGPDMFGSNNLPFRDANGMSNLMDGTTSYAPTQNLGMDSLYNGATNAVPGPWEKLGDYLKTPQGMMRAGTTAWNLLNGFQQRAQAKEMMDMYRAQMERLNSQAFPFQQYHGDMRRFMNDPMAYLQTQAGYKASQDYARQAQLRRNVQTGNTADGYGDSLMASTLGQNADKWQNQTFQQLGGVAGIGFNPASSAYLAQGGLQGGLGQQTASNATLGNAVSNVMGGLKEAGLLEDIFKSAKGWL